MDRSTTRPEPGAAGEPRLELLGLPMWPGDHVCAFYRTPEERDSVLLPFLTDGVKDGDKVTCVVDRGPEDVLARLGESVDVDSYVADGRLEVLAAADTYLAGGGFLAERMLRFWGERAGGGPEIEFTRNVGDMSWAHTGRCRGGEPCLEALARYESELNRTMNATPQVNLCLYDLTRCSGEVVLDVLRTHPKAMLGGMIIDNPWHLDPDAFLAGRTG